MVYSLWFIVYGLWFMVYGLWFMVYGLLFSYAVLLFKLLQFTEKKVLIYKIFVRKFNFSFFNEAFGLAKMFREQTHLLSQDGFWHTIEGQFNYIFKWNLVKGSNSIMY